MVRVSALTSEDPRPPHPTVKWLFFDDEPRQWEKLRLETIASEMEAKAARPSLSLYNHNNWRRVWPEWWICTEMVPRWQLQLLFLPAAPRLIHLQDTPAAEAEWEMELTEPSENLFCHLHSFLSIMFLGLQASCSHLHAAAVMTQNRCLQTRVSNGPRTQRNT